MNPGTSVSSTGYFGIANQIVTFEDDYSSFRCVRFRLARRMCHTDHFFLLSTSDLTIDSTHPANQQSVIFHDAPATPPSSVISQLVGSDQIASIYITDDTAANGGDPYDTFPSEFASFVSTVAADS